MSYNDIRRHTHTVRVGNTTIGGSSPIRLQSMTDTPTLDVDASTAQVLALADAGADIVRLTAQGVNHAKALGDIHARVRAAGCEVPLVADIHFNPAAAFEAARHVEKVRINPGNFADPGRVFAKLEYTDEEYATELKRLNDKLVPLLDLCREHGVALRLGVNHGSLSDRIMSRYGDTPAGMVESAMEYLRICLDNDFDQVVISVKASNVTVMVDTMRLMAKAMAGEGMTFPLHLGVTEAGDGDDARIKSAVGIGSLLASGIGDTIRVSLSEPPVAELPVARMIVDYIDALDERVPEGVRTPLTTKPLVIGYDVVDCDAYEVSIKGGGAASRAKKALIEAAAAHPDEQTLLHITYPDTMTAEQMVVNAAIDFGPSLLDGWADNIAISGGQMTDDQRYQLALGILQATRRRITKTEYIACPGCGRTLFDLHDTLAAIKEATAGQAGLKIGVMGCIVNGPGEMADADYGYVGAAAGHVSLYRGKECVVRNVPTDKAVEAMIDLIKADGRWQ